MSTILLVILILFLVGALPAWPHSTNWGYGPSGGLGVGPVGRGRSVADWSDLTGCENLCWPARTLMIRTCACDEFTEAAQQETVPAA